MPDQQDNKEIARLERINADLSRSLKRCQVLLDECRNRLAANSNEQELADDEEGSRVG